MWKVGRNRTALLVLFVICATTIASEAPAYKKQDILRKKEALALSNKEEKKDAIQRISTAVWQKHESTVKKISPTNKPKESQFVTVNEKELKSNASESAYEDAKLDIFVVEKELKSNNSKSDSSSVQFPLSRLSGTGDEQFLSLNETGNDKKRTITFGTTAITIGPWIPDNLANIIGTLINYLPGISINGFNTDSLGTLGTLFNSLLGIGTTASGVQVVVAGSLGLLAALAAGLAALIKIGVVGLQIANQILAIIGIAMLGAYLGKDSDIMGYFGDSYGEDYDYDSGTGYGTGSFHSGGLSTGHSSYSDYQRSDSLVTPFVRSGGAAVKPMQAAFVPIPIGIATNTIDGSYASNDLDATSRSLVSEGILNRLGKSVKNALDRFEEMYGKDRSAKVPQEKKE